MERAVGSGCDQETVGVGWLAGGEVVLRQQMADQETAHTEVEAARHVVDWYTFEVTATHANRPGAGRCPRP